VKYLVLLLAVFISSSALAAATFTHFTGTSAPSGFTAVTAGNGVLCMNGTNVAGSGGTCTSSISGASFYNMVSAANSDVAFAYTPTLSRSTSKIFWTSMRASSNGFVALIDKATPIADTTANILGASGYVLGRAVLTSTNTLVARYDNTSSRTRTEWSGSAWATPTQNASANIADNFVLIGLEIDGPNDRYRWILVGSSGTTSGLPNYAMYNHTITDWVSFTFHEGGTSTTYCNPTCSNLRILIGDPLNDALTNTAIIESYAEDEGTQQIAFVNVRDNGGTWSIRRAQGYPSSNGFVENFVMEDRSTNVVAVGAGGTWDDANVKDPVVTRGTNGTYYMCYSGSDGAKFSVGFATASSATGTFTKSGSNPIVTLSAGTTEDQAANCQFVEDLSEPDSAKRWKLVYIGLDTSSPIKRYVYVRTCANPPDTCGGWSSKIQLLGPGTGGNIDDLGYARVFIDRLLGRPFVIASAKQNTGSVLRASYGYGVDFQSAATPSLVTMIDAQVNTCNTTTTAGPTATRVLTVASTTGCTADQFIITDDDATAANYHRHRILSVDSSTQLTLYEMDNGTASGALVKGSAAFGQNDVGPPIYISPGKFIMYSTCFDPMLGTANDAYSENICTYQATTPLGPWTQVNRASPAIVGNAFGAQHSLENLSLVQGPLKAPGTMFIGVK
jgi:hypothetical protein